MYSAIRLAPQMDSDTTVRVLNENFTTIENFTDLYLASDIYEFPSVSLAGFASTTQSKVIPHNGNANLRFSSFIQAFPWTNGGTIPAIAEPNVIPGYWGATTYNEVSGTVRSTMAYYIGLDKSNIYFARTCQNTTGSTQTVPASKVWYFIEKEPI